MAAPRPPLTAWGGEPPAPTPRPPQRTQRRGNERDDGQDNRRVYRNLKQRPRRTVKPRRQDLDRRRDPPHHGATPRTLRYVSPGCSDKVAADAEVCSTLITFLRALFTSDITRQKDLLSLLPPSTCGMYPVPDGSDQQQCPHTTLHAEEVMYKCLGFSIDRRPSSLDEAGTGVFVSKGFVPKGALVSMYPGTVYQNYEPVFFQSIGNPFIFRCLDGILIDGNDKGISKSVYRSCSGRNQLGPLKMCDCSWLTSCPRNPLAVGQYINNCSNDRAANVCYQEFDVPESFPVELRQYIPNIRYSHDVEGSVWT